MTLVSYQQLFKDPDTANIFKTYLKSPEVMSDIMSSNLLDKAAVIKYVPVILKGIDAPE